MTIRKAARFIFVARRFMLDKYNILTVTHRQTNLKEIGNFFIEDNSVKGIVTLAESIKSKFNISELMYLATCNRVMFFYYQNDLIDPEQISTDFFHLVNNKLASLNGSLSKHVEIYKGEKAIEHLFEVASSIDSMVLGEREIFRQLREAYKFSNTNGLCGDKIRIAMQVAVKAGKQVYDATKIGEKPVSIVSLAFKELMNLNPKKTSRVLIIGAGQTNQLAAKFFKKYQFTNFTVFNRTESKAKSLATMLDGDKYSLEELNSYKGGFDILFVCTGATTSIIKEKEYKQLLQDDKDKKIVIDLAIPGNVDQAVIDSNDLHYIEVSSLKQLAKENMSFREKEISKVKVILEKERHEFKQLFKRREIERSLSFIPQEIKAIKEKALSEVFAKDLATLDDKTLSLINEMMTYMEKKCVAVPMKTAKKLTD